MGRRPSHHHNASLPHKGVAAAVLTEATTGSTRGAAQQPNGADAPTAYAMLHGARLIWNVGRTEQSRA
jgi:hypothetical protein